MPTMICTDSTQRTFASMIFLGNLRQRAGRIRLSREPELARIRGGTNLSKARRVAILYRDTDERGFNHVRAFAKSLREAFGTKSILVMGYVDLPEKHLPVWQQRKLEFDYITRDDLNWYARPVRHVSGFLEREYDLLIDLSGGRVLPLAFLLKATSAAMKVGWSDSLSAPFCDLTIHLEEDAPMDHFIQQVKHYLSNTQIK